MFNGQYQQSESTAALRRVYFHLVDATDGITPETGEAGGQPEISKNGGSWASTTATLTAIGNGRYYVELTATELNTLGNVQLRYKSAATADGIASAQVKDIPTAAAIADQVWDEVLSGHLTASTTGAALNAASSAGDPWGTTLPGSYGAGTAGKIIGDNINATISSRASQTSVDTIDDFVDTEIGAIKAKTDLIPASPAAVGDIPSASTIAAAVWAYVVEGAYTAKDYMRLMASAMCAKLSGAATTSIVIRDTADTKARISATVDASGNRTAVTLDAT